MLFLYFEPSFDMGVGPALYPAVVGAEPLCGSDSVEQFATIGPAALPDASCIASFNCVGKTLVDWGNYDLHRAVEPYSDVARAKNIKPGFQRVLALRVFSGSHYTLKYLLDLPTDVQLRPKGIVTEDCKHRIPLKLFDCFVSHSNFFLPLLPVERI